MGQCYSINLTGTINKQLLVDLTNQYKTTRKDARWRFDEIKTFREALEEIFTEDVYGAIEEPNQKIEDFDIDAAFTASYGWEPIMTSWFEFVAPAFSSDTVLKILPDEGLTKCWIENGAVLVFEGDWEFLVDETPEYLETYNRICSALPLLTDKQKDALKQHIGYHGGEIDDIETECGDLFTDDEYIKISKAYGGN